MGFNSGFKWLMRGPGSVVSMVAGGSGDRIPVKASFSESVQTGHSAAI